MTNPSPMRTIFEPERWNGTEPFSSSCRKADSTRYIVQANAADEAANVAESGHEEGDEESDHRERQRPDGVPDAVARVNRRHEEEAEQRPDEGETGAKRGSTAGRPRLHVAPQGRVGAQHRP